MNENKPQQCPVAIFLLRKSKVLAEVKKYGILIYHALIDARLTHVWYKTQPIGINVKLNEK